MREGDVVVDTQGLPMLVGAEGRLEERLAGELEERLDEVLDDQLEECLEEELGAGFDEPGERPGRIVRFSPPGHFGPSEIVDPGTFEVSADGFATTLPTLPDADVPGLECRYRSRGVEARRPYTGGVGYVMAEPAKLTAHR